MKVRLVYDQINGKKTFIGYTIAAENEEEVEQLSIIRDYYFWGDVAYDGKKTLEMPIENQPDVCELAFANRKVIEAGSLDSVWKHIDAERH